jgi:thiaminase
VPDALLAQHADAWERATRHPFLLAVRDGTLAPDAFATWLAQDALFVADLLAFQARLLGRAPRLAQAVLAAGALALVEELDWFEELAAGGGTELGQERLPATQAYAELLERLDEASYEVAVTALWVLERVYLLAWRNAAPGAPGYRSCVEHWTSPGFAAYVDALGRLAEDAGAPGDAVAEVLELETAFWDAAGHQA